VVVVLFGLVAALLLLNAVTQLVLGRRLRKARAAIPPPLPRPPRIADPAAPAPPAFQPQRIDLADRSSEAQRELLGRAGRTAQIIQPVSTLFLWVFAPNPNNELMNMVRRRFGPVEMLHGGGYLIGDLSAMPSALFGRGDDHIEVSEAEVLAKIARFPTQRRASWWPINSMLCSDGVWQFALDRMLERSALVVMDLTDFAVEHAGCEYEIGLLVDRVPARRCLFVIGPDTDIDMVLGVLGAAWATMAAGSPNRDPANGQWRIAIGHHLRDGRSRSRRSRGPQQIDAELAVVEDLMREGRGWRLPPPMGSAAAPA